MAPLSGHLLCPRTILGSGIQMTLCGYIVTLQPLEFSVISNVGPDTLLS